MLNNQTVSRRIHFHLINNNYNDKDELENIVKFCKRKYINIKISLNHYKNKYYGFQRFIYIRDILLKKHLIDYVIMIDDDKLFEINWVEKIWELRRPQIYTGWYIKKWESNKYDYWNGSIIKHHHCINQKKKDIIDCDYIGTGGCLIDTKIFNNNSPLWKIPNNLPENVLIYNIEDLWLSFIAKYLLNYKLKRSFLPIFKCFNKINKNSNAVSLFRTLKKEKQLLLKYLVNKYNF